MKTKSQLLLLTLSVLFFSSCGHETNAPGITDDNMGNTNVPLENPQIQNIIAFDVLGGMFNITASDVEGSVNANAGTGKSSNNYSSPADTNIIDASYNFSGAGGRGGLTLIATGISEKIFAGYHYAPLNLSFRFHNFAYVNACLGTVRIDGEISCVIEGDYYTNKRTFKGKALCKNGSTDQPANLLYIAPNANYSVFLDATLTIDGDPYAYDSYTYEGAISIDGAQQKIEALIDDGLSCQ